MVVAWRSWWCCIAFAREALGREAVLRSGRVWLACLLHLHLPSRVRFVVCIFVALECVCLLASLASSGTEGTGAISGRLLRASFLNDLS